MTKKISALLSILLGLCPFVDLVGTDEEQPEVRSYLKEKPEMVTRLRGLHDEWVKDVTPK